MSLILASAPRIKTETEAAAKVANLLLQSGEAVYLTDSKKMKIGNGIDRFNDLPYLGEPGGGMLYIPAPRLVMDNGVLCVLREPWMEALAPLNPRFVLVKKRRANTQRRGPEDNRVRIYKQKSWSGKNFKWCIQPASHPGLTYVVSKPELRDDGDVIEPGSALPILNQPITAPTRKLEKYKIPLNLTHAGHVYTFTRENFIDFMLYLDESSDLNINIGGKITPIIEIQNKTTTKKRETFGIAIEVDLLIDPDNKTHFYRGEAGKFLFGLKEVEAWKKDDTIYQKLMLSIL